LISKPTRSLAYISEKEEVTTIWSPSDHQKKINYTMHNLNTNGPTENRK